MLMPDAGASEPRRVGKSQTCLTCLSRLAGCGSADAQATTKRSRRAPLSRRPPSTTAPLPPIAFINRSRRLVQSAIRCFFETYTRLPYRARPPAWTMSRAASPLAPQLPPSCARTPVVTTSTPTST